MQRKKEIPNKPRFKYVVEKAQRFLLEMGYNFFPIKAEQVLEDMSDIVLCLPWSKARDILHSDDPFHLRQLKADARVVKRRDENKYLIVYDDSTENTPERINWSILHEIGHIILGHLDDFGATSLDRGGISKKEYGVLEVETNFFVGEFIMPTTIIKEFSEITAEEISLLFFVSDKAAKKKYKKVFEEQTYPTELEKYIRRNFFHFLYRDMPAVLFKGLNNPFRIYFSNAPADSCRKCPSCLSYVMDRDAKYCYYCGNDLQLSFAGNILERSRKRTEFIQKPGFTHISLPADRNDDKKVMFCPKCLNHSFDSDARHCNICGSPLYNECTEEHIQLPLDAAYCPNCGAPATFCDVYRPADKRSEHIEEIQPCEDWIKYEYWDFIRMHISNYRFSSKELPSVLYYSNAFFDDDDNLVILADSMISAAIIQEHKDDILSYIGNFDRIETKDVYVKVVNGEIDNDI